MNWQVDATSDQKLHSFYGSDKNGFLLEAHCPRFGTGEGKGMIKHTVRGYDLFIICDVGAYQCTYKLYGREVPMTPDEHYADLKRIIAAVSGKSLPHQRHHADALRRPPASPHLPRVQSRTAP